MGNCINKDNLYRLPECDYKQRINPEPVAYPIDGDRKNGIFRQIGVKELYTTPFPEQPWIQTTTDALENSAKVYSSNLALGQRVVDNEGHLGDYNYNTYQQLFQQIIQLGRGLKNLCPYLTRDSPIGIYSVNSRNLMMSILACHSQSLRIVPLYDTLGANACEFICKQTELSVIFTTLNHLDTVKTLIESSAIKCIVILDAEEEKLKDIQINNHVSLFSFNYVLHCGPLESIYQQHDDDWRPTGDTICHIFYTSGTTGVPKGVLISHRGIMFTAASFLRGILWGNLPVTERDGVISYLPLAHGYATAVEFAVMTRGVRIPYFSGHLSGLLDDIKYGKPSLFIAVPRVLNKIKTEIIKKLSSMSTIKQYIVSIALHNQTLAMRKGTRVAIWDKLVFNQLISMFGGNLRFFAVGAAPMNPEDSEFLSVCFNAPLLEGYGLTETSAASFMTLNNGHAVFGNVGAPFIATEYKLESCPELGYTTDDLPYPRGEICIRGECLFKGYYKNEEETQAVFDQDGFFHTGDIGRINDDNSLSVIDRKKNIFKLAQGEYVAAEHLESIYEEVHVVQQIFIFGNSHERYLIGIVGLDPVLGIQLMNSLQLQTIEYGKEGWKEQYAINCKNPLLHDTVLTLLQDQAKQHELRGFEIVKDIYIEGILSENNMIFTDSNNMLTPTFKLKRHNCQVYYQSIIDDLYAKMSD